MALDVVVNMLFTNNGITFQLGLIFLLALCSILMSLQDWRISVMSFFLGSVVEYIAFYYLFGADSLEVITLVLFVSIIIMAFSILAIRSGGKLID